MAPGVTLLWPRQLAMLTRFFLLLSYNRQFFMIRKLFGGALAGISHQYEGRPITRVAGVAVAGTGAGKGSFAA